MRRLLVTALMATALLGAALADAETVQKGTLRVSVSGEFSPSRLPREGAAPIAVSVGGRIGRTNGGLPPQLKTLRIELNRRGRLQTQGLPVCRVALINPASTERAQGACRGALVGRGRFAVDVSLAGQEPYPTTGTLLLFNGVHRGRPALLGHLYSARPFTNSFVIPFAIGRESGRGDGTVLTASMPRSLRRWGYLRELRMRLGRRYRYRGRSRSFISAGCPAPKGFGGAVFDLARTSFDFAGGRRLIATLTRSCSVR